MSSRDGKAIGKFPGQTRAVSKGASGSLVFHWYFWVVLATTYLKEVRLEQVPAFSIPGLCLHAEPGLEVARTRFCNVYYFVPLAFACNHGEGIRVFSSGWLVLLSQVGRPHFPIPARWETQVSPGDCLCGGKKCPSAHVRTPGRVLGKRRPLRVLRGRGQRQ